MSSVHQRLAELRDQLTKLDPYPWASVETWIAAAKPLVRVAFPDHIDDFENVCRAPNWTALPRVSTVAEAAQTEQTANKRKAAERRDGIVAFVSGLLTLHDEGKEPRVLAPVERLCRIIDRFPLVVRALVGRGRNRTPLTIDDEYDVHYLLGGLLAVEFDDVRAEEWTPSYAGNSSHVDFLLKAEQIVVETKFARPGHADKDIANELIIDKERYRAHADCTTLLCFVYDAAHVLRNPVALERDLAGAAPRTIVAVRPR